MKFPVNGIETVTGAPYNPIRARKLSVPGEHSRRRYFSEGSVARPSHPTPSAGA